MNEVIGSLLPLGLAVALSPFPIIMVVLLLGSARPRGNGLAFLGGWLVGIAAIIAILTFAIDALEDSGASEPNVVVGVLRILLGVALLVMAARKFIKRFGPSDDGGLPGWMASASSYSPGRSFGMGLVLSAANPKNLALTAAGGIAIGEAAFSITQELWAALTYLLIASVTVLVPVSGYLIAPQKMGVPLGHVMAWLRVNHAIMTGLLLLVFGFVLIGNGIGSF
ncbi:GAP family protein [Arthrobacter sp. GMC3]|uniref:GAP family protein n=1 Tax=Arthrobacter sp. GMC3 TaxID=2058894 RepID=UPI000CE395F8|nr:GAP family protein [Arthrobacter sp. GMC3]